MLMDINTLLGEILKRVSVSKEVITRWL